MANNFENHRIAKEGESTCKTCWSFNGTKCDSCDTNVGHTFEHNTCRYHLYLVAIGIRLQIVPNCTLRCHTELVEVLSNRTKKRMK